MYALWTGGGKQGVKRYSVAEYSTMDLNFQSLALKNQMADLTDFVPIWDSFLTTPE